MSKEKGVSSAVRGANIELYKRYAKKYNRLERSLFMKENQERIKKIIRDLAKGREDGKFLDIGCGSGNVLKFAEPVFAETFGLDISLEMLREFPTKKSLLVRGDVTALPFKSDEFEVVTCYSLLHHVKDVDKLIEECFRVLKKGGVVYTDNDPNVFFQQAFGWWRKMRFAMSKRKFKKEFGREFYEIYSLAEYHRNFGGMDPFKLKEKFEKAGFSKVEIFFRFHPKPDSFTKALRLISKVYDKPHLYDNFMIFATK